MVSLGDDSRRSGGHFFTPEPQSDGDTEDLLRDSNSLGPSHKGVPVRFKKIKTVWTTPILLLLLVCLEVALFIVPDCLPRAIHSPFSLLIYCHVFIWILFFCADRFARWQHHLSRKNGYLDFYRKTCNLRRLPFFIVSFGNAVLLALTTLIRDYCPHHPHPQSGDNDTLTIPTPSPHNSSLQISSLDADSWGPWSDYGSPHTKNSTHSHCLGLPLKKENFLQIVVSVEVGILVVVLLLYLVKVILFNRRASAPDILDQDNSTTSDLQAHTSPAEVGFSEEPCMEEVMEKQAEMIRYLKEHNAALGRRVMELTALNSS